MRFGLLSWSIRSLMDGAPWEDSLRATAAIGYRATELITCTPEDLDTYWYPKAESLKAMCADLDLRISQFAIFQPVIGDLSSLDEARRAKSLENFKKAADVANRLGSGLLNFVAQWPVGIEAPIAYVPRYYYVDDIGGEPKLKMKLPAGFDWEAIWARYIETIAACLNVCKGHGLKLSVEGHIHVMVPNTDSLLRLWDNFRDPSLAFTLDIGWHFLQREYIPWSIHKLGRRLAAIHLRDCDGLARHFVCPGMGAIDWPSIREALNAVGYAGDVNVELSEFDERREEVARIAFELISGHFTE
jgi:sugar phosphate isomerase/epimerase